MLRGNQIMNAEQITVIVKDGQASRILKYAKKHGIKGGTIMLGKGTIRNKLFDYMGLSELRKEVVMMLADKEASERVLKDLNREFEFEKRDHGIAFTTSVCDIVGSKQIVCEIIEEEGDPIDMKYHIITVIVDKGKGELVIEAAQEAGSTGGTIINARGAGAHEITRIFAMDVEPEKEVVLILSKTEGTNAIVDSVRTHLDIDKPGNGIIYVQTAASTYGIFE